MVALPSKLYELVNELYPKDKPPMDGLKEVSVGERVSVCGSSVGRGYKTKNLEYHL